jgi:outer membrane protein OmpA-like peptidoglycan-associated protein
MSDNDDKKSPPTMPTAGGPRILAPQGPGSSNPSVRPPTPGAPVVNDPGSSSRGARPPRAAALPPGASKAPEIRARKKRTNWLPTMLVALLAIGCTVVWFAPISWPLEFSLPRFDGLFGSSPKSAPAPAARQETAAPQKPAAQPIAAPTPPASPPPPAKEAAVPEDEQKRRMAAVEERLASATTQSVTDKRTIETLQARLADSERQAKGLQQRAEALEQELVDLRQTSRESRPAIMVPREARELPPAAGRQTQAAAPIPAVRPSAPPAPVQATQTPPAPRAVGAPGPSDGNCASLAARYRNPVILQFGRNQDVLRADHERQLSQIAASVAPCADIALMIRGFTDSRGPDNRNVELSKRRADLAARFIEGRGVAKNRLSVSGFASAAPVATNDTDAGRARNRRVELTVQPLR